MCVHFPISDIGRSASFGREVPTSDMSERSNSQIYWAGRQLWVAKKVGRMATNLQ
jgi:hypothetical protein